MTLTQLRRALVAIAVVASVATPGTAHAVTDTAYLVGTGTYAPGLPLTGCVNNNNIEYTGTLVVVGDHPGAYHLEFHGNSDRCDTLVESSGAGSLAGDVGGTAQYHRTGKVSTWRGAFSLNGIWHDIIDETCWEDWTSYNPVTSFVIVCELLLETR